jgi:hypothetical protein
VVGDGVGLEPDALLAEAVPQLLGDRQLLVRAPAGVAGRAERGREAADRLQRAPAEGHGRADRAHHRPAVDPVAGVGAADEPEQLGRHGAGAGAVVGDDPRPERHHLGPLGEGPPHGPEPPRLGGHVVVDEGDERPVAGPEAEVAGLGHPVPGAEEDAGPAGRRRAQMLEERPVPVDDDQHLLGRRVAGQDRVQAAPEQGLPVEGVGRDDDGEAGFRLPHR